MSWFGDDNTRPILGSDREEKDRKAADALRNQGVSTYKMVGTYCDKCRGEDGDHIPGTSCEGVN